MAEILPKIPIEYNALRDALRRGLTNNESRYYWWPNLANVNASGMIESYPEMGAVAERLTALLAEETAAAARQPTKGKANELIVTTNSILQVLIRTKIMSADEVPLFETILRVVVSVVKRGDVCCMLAGDLLTNREKYVPITIIFFW